MTDRVTLVGTGPRAYPVATGALPALLTELPDDLSRAPVVAVVDERVDALHGEHVRTSFAAAGMAPAWTTVPSGEASKSLDGYAELCRFLGEQSLDRSAVIFGIGGGVTTDLAGFAAATLLRGIDWVAVPTTVLGVVDAAIGGKTGIDFEGGKNILGAFHQPRAVLCDPAFLATLDERNHRSGLAEAVKAAIIRDRDLFEMMEADPAALLDPRSPALGEVLHRAAAVKAAVVTADEREAGERAILNLGHTFAHALESATGFRRWTHGEAVAMGIMCAAYGSVREVGLAESEYRRIERCLLALGLPTGDPDLAPEALLPWLGRDKKTRRGEPQFVLTARIGSASFGHEISQVFVLEILARFFGGRS